jgi:hypothetical protein
MSTERKTELGRDLQRRADIAQSMADDKSRGTTGRERAKAKAQAYAHAAELADAEGAK